MKRLFVSLAIVLATLTTCKADEGNNNLPPEVSKMLNKGIADTTLTIKTENMIYMFDVTTHELVSKQNKEIYREILGVFALGLLGGVVFLGIFSR